MKDFEITADMVKHQVKKIKNWTAPEKMKSMVTGSITSPVYALE